MVIFVKEAPRVLNGAAKQVKPDGMVIIHRRFGLMGNQVKCIFSSEVVSNHQTRSSGAGWVNSVLTPIMTGNLH